MGYSDHTLKKIGRTDFFWMNLPIGKSQNKTFADGFMNDKGYEVQTGV
jgi:hypothetical protein